MWIRNSSGFYICEIRGVCFLTWVNERDKGNAFNFRREDIDGWIKLLSKWAGEPLEAVEPFS